MNNPRTKTVALLNESPRMKQIVDMEPEVLDILLTGALSSPGRRWQTYTMLKRACRPYIGHGARYKELATPAHWDALTAFLDALLPESEDAEEREETRI